MRFIKGSILTWQASLAGRFSSGLGLCETGPWRTVWTVAARSQTRDSGLIARAGACDTGPFT